MRKRCAVILVLLLFSFTACSFPVLPPSEEPFSSEEPLSSEEPSESPAEYWQSKLNDDERLLYSQLLKTSDLHLSSLTLSSPLRSEAVNRVLDFFLLDHPENFWWGRGYTLSGIEPRVNSVSLTLLYSETEIAAMQREIDGTVDEIFSLLPENADEYETALFLHDWLCRNVSYTSASEKDGSVYSLYGALAEKQAVCEGYAEAFLYLCRKAGIPCLCVTGKAEGNNHKWNAVCLNGEWSFTDVTWDSSELSGGALHRYFAVSEEVFFSDHTPDEDLLSLLPFCTAEQNSYYVHNRLVCTADTLCEVFVRACKEAFAAADETVTVELYAAENASALHKTLTAKARAWLSDAGVAAKIEAFYKPYGNVLIVELKKLPEEETL